MPLKKLLIDFLTDEAGGPTSEYALVVFAFALVMIVAMQAVSTTASHQLASTQTNLQNNAVSPP